MQHEPFLIDADTPAALLRLCPAHAATPLRALPRLADALGVASVLVKDEGQRPLGSFKALGGVYAGLRALARAAGMPVAGLLDPARPRTPLPALVCASDGNHGLAVAAAARLAGTRARVFLPAIVPEARAGRIAAKGAEIVRVAGTYDEAVRAAGLAARDGGALLIADTTEDPADPVVRDVMAGYAVMAEEIRTQIAADGHAAPTHLFVQAGVGGLAAAMADALHALMAPPARIVVVEPAGAACVAAALAAGRPVAVSGALETAAEMLSCGEASAPALAILQRHAAQALAVSEAALLEAPGFLAAYDGPGTTPSGAAGVAGVRAATADPAHAARLGLGPESRVLLLVTEAVPAGE
ncbi:MAG TPA: pyridoxal-phosphate dependent enzyme [Acetobacteraceae bacterium]|nr:pyridoxal-phosphate dependent enzyme [Acetobacteraceae bacterium]